MLWSQQFELEEETRLHSYVHMPKKMLSLYYDPSNPSKPVKTTSHPTISRSQTFKQVTKANTSQKELTSSSFFYKQANCGGCQPHASFSKIKILAKRF